MSEMIQSLRGMPDVLAPQAAYRAQLSAKMTAVLHRFGYQPAYLPLLEKTALFKRTIGDATDVVSKEMYTFDDRNGESVTLRPEATAGVVRAMIQNGLLQQNTRLYTEGPMFRYEKPQEGRYRQFTQVSVESFGIAAPAQDAELIQIAYDLFAELGILDAVTLEINTIGMPEERIAFQKALVDYLAAHKDKLDEDSQRRLDMNPLRILDSKDAGTQALLHGAPQLADYLGEESRGHYRTVKQLLDSIGIAYRENPRLVRGLDYYCHTVIEWTTDKLGAQGTICAGGRYDGLVEQLGGKPTPAAGFAFGVERILLLAQQYGAFSEPRADVYILAQSEAEQGMAMRWAGEIRRHFPEFSVITHNAFQKLKTQFKKADQANARYTLVFGSEEAAQNAASVKNMATGGQQTLTLAALLQQLQGEV